MLNLSSAFVLLYLESPSKAITQTGTATTTKQDGGNMSIILKLLSDVIETRINKSSSLLELTSKLPEVTNVSYANMITEKFMGIPQSLDLQKRNIARNILEKDRDIASIFFLIPKGDTYMGEPYPDQQQLPRLNYADRDWYKGVTRTNDTYTSAVFLSAAIHVPAIAIAVPVYENNIESNVGIKVNQTSLQSIVGYWVGIINPVKINEDLSDFNLLNSNNKVLLIDHNGTRVFESLPWSRINVTSLPSSSSSSSPLFNSQSQSLKSFSYLQSVQNALEGQSGSTGELIDGIKTIIYYYPVQIHPHTWALLLLQTSK
jgi:hypothetical protein